MEGDYQKTVNTKQTLVYSESFISLFGFPENRVDIFLMLYIFASFNGMACTAGAMGPTVSSQ